MSWLSRTLRDYFGGPAMLYAPQKIRAGEGGAKLAATGRDAEDITYFNKQFTQPGENGVSVSNGAALYVGISLDASRNPDQPEPVVHITRPGELKQAGDGSGYLATDTYTKTEALDRFRVLSHDFGDLVKERAAAHTAGGGELKDDRGAAMPGFGEYFKLKEEGWISKLFKPKDPQMVRMTSEIEALAHAHDDLSMHAHTIREKPGIRTTGEPAARRPQNAPGV